MQPAAALAGLPPEPAEPEPIRLQWYGADLRSGRVVEELPALRASGLARTICRSETAQATLTLAGAPAGWEAATDPGRTMLAAALDDRLVWAGSVLRRTSGSSGEVHLDLATLEAYLDRRYVRDHTWTGRDEVSVIVAGLVGDAAAEGIGLELDCPPTGTPRDREYKDIDDRTVYSALTALSGVIGGPEWTIDLVWDGASRIRKIFRARRRLGVASVRPNAVFEMPGCVVSYEYVEDYGPDKGANHIIAKSSGEGDERPESTPARAEALLATGWPRYENRWTPSTSTTNTATLDSHAQARLGLRGLGGRTWALTAKASRAPRLGAEWGLGDDIAYDLRSPRHPGGASGVGRCIGWQLSPAGEGDEVVPILWEPAEEDEGGEA